MELRILHINFLLMIWFPPVRTIVIYTLGSNCSLPLGSECPGVPNSECDSQGKCNCRQPDYYLNTNVHVCQKRAYYGLICLSGIAQAECLSSLTCYYIQANFGKYCLCPSGQFGYMPNTGMCRNATTLRADNLHLNGPPNETELSLAWDRPLNVSDPLTYRMVINGTEEITPIYTTMYTLTKRQPGTPYQIQIYTSTFKDFGVTEEKIENNNPLQGTLCTKPAVPGSLATNTYSTINVTLQFSKSEGRVERYNVTIIAKSSGQSFTERCPSDGATGVWRNVTFYNLDPGEFYDVRIKAISCGMESEDKLDFFVIRAPFGWSCLSGPTPAECSIGLSCVYIPAKSENLCVCPSGQFVSQPRIGMCRNVTRLRADNLHLNGPPKETELSLAWDRPLNVSVPLTYRMEINGTENITSISINMYTLTNRQPGTPYQIQIYTSTFKDFGVTEEKIENNNPLQETFCTKPAVPGSLSTNLYSKSSITLQFFKSDGRVESYSVTVTASSSSVSQNQLITSDGVVRDWRNATFYNLVPGELYEVTIKAISCGLESEGRIDYFIMPIYNEQQENDASNGILMGSVVGGLCLFIIVVMTICIALRRRRRQAASSVLQQSNQLELPSMSRMQQSNSELAKIQGPCVRLDQFIQYVDQMNKQDNDPLRREFETLKASIAPEMTTNIGRLKVNNVKNRYFNAVPYDQTRVKLLAFGDGFNDYINASYIAGPLSSCDYIATQGPMFSTTPDFWRMVCEHRSGIIVMLSDFSEDGQRKLDKYWPDQIMTPVLYGEVLVEVTSCSIATTATIRKMIVSMTGRNKLTVTHIFSPGWKNYAYTLGLDELYDVISSVRKVAPSNEGPITVHCSSGIGRTGMFISLDTLMRILVKTDLNSTVNVNSVVKTILECRPHIIQSEDQYIFIHTALSAFIEKKKQILKQSTYDPRRLPSIIDESHIYASLDETAQMKQGDTHF